MKGMSTQHRGRAAGQLRAGPQLCHDLHLRRRHRPDQAGQTARDHTLVIIKHHYFSGTGSVFLLRSSG